MFTAIYSKSDEVLCSITGITYVRTYERTNVPTPPALCLGPPVKVLDRHWVGHFSPPLPKMGLGMVFWPCQASISGSEALFSLCRGNHWPTAVTIERSLESGSDLSYKSAQDGCNGTFKNLPYYIEYQKSTVGVVPECKLLCCY